MIAAVFVRRLREGVTFEEFERAWEADEGYGVPARIFNAVSLEDPREVLSIGFVGIPAEAMKAVSGRAAEHDEARHHRVDEVIESTELRAMYELRSEHDFTDQPRAIEVGSAESLLGSLPSLSMAALATRQVKSGVHEHAASLHRRLRRKRGP
jgi:hypothetical protein